MSAIEKDNWLKKVRETTDKLFQTIPQIMAEKEKVKFCCPICGSAEYGEKIEHMAVYGLGGMAEVVVNYICAGCSVHFDDPELFTKAGKPKEKKEMD